MPLNLQTPEKRVDSDGTVLSVHSIFHTIQGEGPFCGTPAVFVRLAGCNLQCPLCDTDYTTGRRILTTQEVVSRVLETFPDRPKDAFFQKRLVVITGGEPFRQNLQVLLALLLDYGFFVQIETNGSLAPCRANYQTNTSRRWGVYVVCSPKAGSVNRLLAPVICAYKYVVAWNDVMDDHDGLPLHPLDHPSKPWVARPPVGSGIPIYIQPTDHQNSTLNNKSLTKCVELCLKYGYILQLQTHKILGLA